jgi:hypothetical protein
MQRELRLPGCRTSLFPARLDLRDLPGEQRLRERGALLRSRLAELPHRLHLQLDVPERRAALQFHW